MPAQEYLQDLQVPKFIHCKNHKRCNCIQLRRQVPRSYVSSKWRLLALATGVSATRLRLPQRNLKCPLLQQLNYNSTNTHTKKLWIFRQNCLQNLCVGCALARVCMCVLYAATAFAVSCVDGTVSTAFDCRAGNSCCHYRNLLLCLRYCLFCFDSFFLFHCFLQFLSYICSPSFSICGQAIARANWTLQAAISSSWLWQLRTPHTYTRCRIVATVTRILQWKTF